jgi:hypothetical protein
MDEEISNAWCVVGWIAATGIFLLFARLSGGPAWADSSLSVYSTWAIAHGEFACAFPSVTAAHQPLIAPVYPLFSGSMAAIAQIGHSVPFPPRIAMGANCQHADVAIGHWAIRAGASDPTRAIGYASWLVLLAGIVAWLRSTGRGWSRWEPLTLLVIAALPVVTAAVAVDLHPQDLIALGLALAAMACVRRDRWRAAGALIALALLSQQFAVLIAAPLLVLAPPTRRARYVGAGVAAAIVLLAPLVVLGGSNVLRASAVGSGNNSTIGGAVMWELGHSGTAVVVFSRLLPIVLAVALSWWSVRRLGVAAASPVAMMSIVATSLGPRLVFEQSIFEYYFMALAVTLILLDVTRGRIRGSTVTWLVTMLMTFSIDGYFLDESAGLHLAPVLPPLVVLTALTLGVFGLATRRRWPLWNVLLWAFVAGCALTTWVSHVNPFAIVYPKWLLQIVFACTGTVVAVTPLLEMMRGRNDVKTSGSGSVSSLSSVTDRTSVSAPPWPWWRR